ncbi:tRNA (N6-isopentenyl adenosine(37)-C2)-methylthiotransferase MiaB, partial [Candidatus Parcubacteria bacterium]|nr:tRNA (N6-isopentenyl adenosine(37)-C2)-methylthiotransferase MiaB [Candidatus Parcubacteria bacterium]
MKKFFIFTFGCQMQKADSERIKRVLEKINYKETQKENEANLILINMCSVRQSAVDRVYGLAKKFQKLKIKNPKLKTLLTGCISKRDFEKFKNFFDFILPIKTLPDWPKFLKKDKFFYFPNQREKAFVEKAGCEYLKIKPKYSKKFSVFVPISTGCDNFCTFCIVPFVRGPLICRDHKEILKEAKKAIENGAKEIWLLGQNVNDYLSPSDSSVNFAKLLRFLEEIEGNFWIRFTSPHPKNFSNDLIETMAKCQKVTPYLNLPLQSGDDEILRKMNRNYTAKEYTNLVKKIRLAFKKYRKGLEKYIAISTDIIVGFPGETKKQFENTVKLFKKIKFDMAYIAKFSPRPGTFAEKMKNSVSEKEKEKRWKILNKILKEIALKKNKKFIGKRLLVLPEEYKNGFLIGKTRHYKTVKVKGEK